MKTYFVFVIALTLSFSAVAQKKEIKTATKELVKGNYEKAGAALDAAEAFLGSMEEKYKSQYYLQRSIYYFNKGEADISGILKSIEALKLVSGSALEQGINDQTQNLKAHLVNKGSSLIDAQDYKSSADYFENAYKLSPSDTIYLFYAALTAVNAKMYDRSLSMYEELRALNFTGIEDNFYATNIETQGEELFASKVVRDISVKSKSHVNPRDEKSASKFPEILKNMALIYVQNGENDKALEAMTVARENDPENVGLIISEANVYLKLEQDEKASELFKEALSKSPDNADLAYNIGVLSMNSDKLDDAEIYLNKALVIDPSYAKAALNLSTISVNNGNALNDKMNTLGTSRADFDKYDELKDEKNKFFEEGAKLLSDFLTSNPEILNIDILTQLKNIYSALGETTKENEIKEKLAGLESQE